MHCATARTREECGQWCPSWSARFLSFDTGKRTEMLKHGCPRVVPRLHTKPVDLTGGGHALQEAKDTRAN